MGFSDAEPHRAKHAGQVRRVQRALQLPIDHAFVDQILQRPEAGDVRLGFLDRRIELLQLLAYGRLFTVDRDVVYV